MLTRTAKLWGVLLTLLALAAAPIGVQLAMAENNGDTRAGNWWSTSTSASAYFGSYDPTGEFYTAVYIEVGSYGSSVTPRKPSDPYPYVSIMIEIDDYWYPIQVLTGSTADFDFTYDEKELSQGHLVAKLSALSLIDYVTWYPITIDLTWTADGELVANGSTTHYDYETYWFHERTKGISRAQTASGSIVLDATPNVNLIPAPTSEAVMGSGEDHILRTDLPW